MADLKILIKRGNMDIDMLQGYRNTWRTEKFSSFLPNPLSDFTNTLNTQSMCQTLSSAAQ
jgi:hypothetical protein